MRQVGRGLARCAAIGILTTSWAHAADEFTLVSKDAFEAEQRFEAQSETTPKSLTRSLEPAGTPPAPPVIRVIAPRMGDQAIVSPIRIELTFETSPDAHVVPDSFRVLYGLLKVDITQKLRPYAKVTDKGLVAEKAALPAGNHRPFLQISDSAGRTSVTQLRFTVDR
jgi:hypothetical protein